MAFRLELPDIGEGIVEAEVQRWFVGPGDLVEEDQPLVEVMTDKATVVIPSPRRGRIVRLFRQAGDVAAVHAPLVEMEIEEGEPSGAAGGEAGRDAVRRKALATPAVRALAREMGVDVDLVPGTGPGGRVTKDDLAKRRAGKNGERRSKGNGASTSGRPKADRETPRDAGPEDLLSRDRDGAPLRPLPAAPPPAATPPDERLPLRGIRGRMAEHMARAKRTAAHFTFVEQADVTELVRLRERAAAAAEAEGAKLTFLPFVVKAVVAALRKHPRMNATMDEERGELVVHRRYDLGIASATEAGLVVPVLRGADRLSILDVAREVERLAEEARAGRLRPGDLGRSTFTITSLGALGGLFATPILNHPEVGILGVHRIRQTPLVRDGQVVVRDAMHVSVTCDHRVIDGREAAEFAYEVVRRLEDPDLLLVHMA